MRFDLVTKGWGNRAFSGEMAAKSRRRWPARASGGMMSASSFVPGDNEGNDRASSFDGRLRLHWQLDRAPYYMETNLPGIFAAGDVRHGSVKRCASAVGEGAMAVTFVHRYLANG